MARFHASRLFATALLAAAAAVPAAAGSLEIGPTRIQMIGPERTATVRLRNSASTPSTIQVRTADWTQTDGADVLTPSLTLLASPPLVKLDPGESQVIRLVVEHVETVPTERAYRLIFDELPADKQGGGAGIQTAVRALVPVFLTASLQSRPKLSWSAMRSGNTLRLTAHNDGEANDRLVNVKVTAGGRALGAWPIEGYVLSRSSRTWMLPATTATTLTLDGEGSHGAVKADVPVSQ